MIDVRSSAGGDALYLREIHTRAATTHQTVDGDQLPRDAPSHTSLGRLLRLLADPRSNENHMEAAIAQVDASVGGVASGAMDASPVPKAAFSLADHRHISNLETVVRAADRAIGEQATAATAENAVTGGALVRALASALVTQSVDECLSTKANLCVWSAQSKKRLRLLQWLLGRSSQTTAAVVEGIFRPQLLSREPGAKSSQLTVCLVVFELAQRVRRHHGESATEAWNVLIDPLIEVMHSSTVHRSTGVKVSKLGLVALDTLLAVLCVTSLSVSPSSEAINATVLNGMQVALKTLIQWNLRSSKRQWLLVAARQLQIIVGMVSPHGESHETLEMVAWHWNATAIWLCSRSDPVLAAKKKIPVLMTQTIHGLYDGLARSESTGFMQLKSSHVTAATLRLLCVLHNLQSVTADELRNSVFTTFEETGKLMISLATACASLVSRELAVEMLCLYLLGKTSQSSDRLAPLLLLGPTEIKAFIMLIVKLHTSNGDVVSETVVLFAAELCLTYGISIVSEIQASDSPSLIHFWSSSLLRALSQYRGVFAEEETLCRQWLRDTTMAVLRLSLGPQKAVRVAALKLLCKVDLTVAMKAVGQTYLYELDPKTSGSLVTMLFLHGDHLGEAKTTELADVLVETLHQGPTSHEATVNSPSDVGTGPLLDESTSERFQALSMALSIQGWCTQATHLTRIAVLTALIRTAFRSPRDPWPLSWLRELSRMGWFETGLANILPLITVHMQELARLTEDILDDDSGHASKTVEQLLFARLAPNLILRVIPRSAFHQLYKQEPTKLLAARNDEDTIDADKRSQPCLHDLTQLLWSQALDSLEFKDVKMLAIELLTKLPAQEILPHALAQLVTFLREQGSPIEVLATLVEDDEQIPATGGGFVTAKLMMYYLNRLFTDDITSGASKLARGQTWSVLLTVLSLPCDPEESFSAQRSPLVDLQMGAIECLALLVSQSLKQPRNSEGASHNCIEDFVAELILGEPASFDASEYDTVALQWRAAVRCTDEGRDHFSMTQLQICCCNVLLSSMSKLDDASLPSFQDRVLRSVILSSWPVDACRGPVLAGRLQVMFSYIFRAGSTLQPTDRASVEIVANGVNTVVGILHSPMALGDQAYMSSLKLLGALIGKVSWLWSSLSQSESDKLATGLKNLRDTDHTLSPPVRQLAQSLLEAFLQA